jgi:2-polyprenyl-6-methoxyphenol hydroxylase-like FAD-dependent oxidoreductase
VAKAARSGGRHFTVSDYIKIRPVDLYVSTSYRQQGFVLVGDAFSTSCPAAGTGVRKALVDVERLCKIHIPRWLATPGMGQEKISAFYDDPAKQSCDALSLRKAFELRSFSTDPALYWKALRWAKFLAQAARGAILGSSLPRHQFEDDIGRRYGSDIADWIASHRG